MFVVFSEYIGNFWPGKIDVKLHKGPFYAALIFRNGCKLLWEKFVLRIFIIIKTNDFQDNRSICTQQISENK